MAQSFIPILAPYDSFFDLPFDLDHKVLPKLFTRSLGKRKVDYYTPQLSKPSLSPYCPPSLTSPSRPPTLSLITSPSPTSPSSSSSSFPSSSSTDSTTLSHAVLSLSQPKRYLITFGLNTFDRESYGIMLYHRVSHALSQPYLILITYF